MPLVRKGHRESQRSINEGSSARKPSMGLITWQELLETLFELKLNVLAGCVTAVLARNAGESASLD